MKILVFGAAGMLGHDLMDVLTGLHSLTGVDLEECDIRDAEACLSLVRRLEPDWIVNSAAFTAVDECETRQDEAMAVNATGPENLARAARTCGARLLHVSTDYVFNGEGIRPYCETDLPDPRTAYGRTKLEGEIRVGRIMGEHALIVRTAWLFGHHGKNFVDTILGLADRNPVIRVVNDQWGCPTFSRDLAAGIGNLIRHGARGIVHVTNSGYTTWHEFAAYFLSKTHPEVRVEPVPTSEFPRPAPRPRYSVLSTSHFKNITGGFLPAWQNAVDRYLSVRYPELLLKE